MEGVKYASKEFQPQQNLLSSLISNIKKRGDGGTLNQGQISVVGEKGPELMMAKQDVNIVPNQRCEICSTFNEYKISSNCCSYNYSKTR